MAKVEDVGSLSVVVVRFETVSKMHLMPICSSMKISDAIIIE